MKKSRRRGRPPKKIKKDTRLVVLVENERKDMYQAAADQLGIDLAVWVRQILDRALEEQ